MIPGLFYHIVCWICVYVCTTPKPYIDVNVNASITFLFTYTYLQMKSLEIRLYSHWSLFLADYTSPFMQILHGLAAWQHQAITWSKVDLSSKVFCDIYPDIYVKTTAMEFERAVILKSMLYSHTDILYCINANKFQHFLIEIQHVSCSWKLQSSASWRPLFSVSMIKKFQIDKIDFVN